MTTDERLQHIADVMSDLDKAKRSMAKLGWFGEMRRLDELIDAASRACIEVQKPASFGALSPFMAGAAGVTL